MQHGDAQNCIDTTSSLGLPMCVWSYLDDQWYKEPTEEAEHLMITSCKIDEG